MPKKTEEKCPNAAAHADAPSGYTAFFAWADKKSKTHDQIKCEGCGRYRIWVPKMSKAHE